MTDIFHEFNDTFSVSFEITNEKINDLLNMYEYEQAHLVYPEVWGSLRDVDYASLDEEEWDTLKEVIIIYYICRLRLFGKPLPLI